MTQLVQNTDQIKNTYTLVESSFDKRKKEDEISMYLDKKYLLTFT